MKILYVPNELSQQRQFQKKANIYPVRMAMEAQWHREHGDQVTWKTEKIKGQWGYDKIIHTPENIPFLELPAPDRVFTQAKKYSSGNYKHTPGTHILSASGCWWGKCSFCVEKEFPYQIREVESVIDEIIECKRLGFREVFDDSATFPTGQWLDSFCHKMRHNNLVKLGCNMRMVDIDYACMKSAGFRMVLFGMESANQHTLDMIHKGTKEEDIKYVIKAAEAGLDCHICVMFGYPWENDDDAKRTLSKVHYLLKKGYAKTAQASFYSTPEGNIPSAAKYIPKIYDVKNSPEFWFNQLKDIRNIDDIKYLWLKIKTALRK